MSLIREEVNYEDLDYGTYILDYESPVLNENVRYTNAEFDKLYFRRIRLPDGKGNLVYLLSDTFDNSLKMINGKNFFIPPIYRKIFYPWISFGGFMGRRYKFNLISQRSARLAMIKERTKLRPYMTRKLSKTSENIFFSVADIYQVVQPIMQRFSIKKVFTQFFESFNDIITDMTPPIDKESDNKSWNNRILLIDADRFQFKNGAPVKDNQTNPLFLLYLAFMRTRDLSKLNVDRDMLITSRNMFIKFNPAKISPYMWPKFRIALFKIMNANLDDYTENLSDQDKEEIEYTSEDHLTTSIVNDTLDPYTKRLSSSTKDTVRNAVTNVLEGEIKANRAVDRLIKSEQDKVAKNINPDKPVTSFQRSIPELSKKLSPPSSSFSDMKNVIPKTISNASKAMLQRKENLFNAIGGKSYDPLIAQEDEDDETEIDDEYEEDSINEYDIEDIKGEVNDILHNNEDVIEEVVDEIQEKIVPIKNTRTSPVNSARDQKLREVQKKVVVQNSSIEEILERDTSNVPIKSDNKSSVMKTSNPNMREIKFANFDKTYIEELYTKDIVACFDMLKDKETPFYITGISVNDTSTATDLKETWSVHLIDEKNERHTITVDIPKFYNDRFMLIGGNKYIILKQNLYNPIVKDTRDTVIITTNYFKITVQRKATKSLEVIERIFSLMKKIKDPKIFISGDSSRGNNNYISSLEYDELSRNIFRFSSNECELYFSRDYIDKNLKSQIPKDIRGNEFFIGTERNEPIVINEDTGRDRSGRTISDIIEENLSTEYKAIYNSIKAPKQSMYAIGKLSGAWVPIAVILTLWIGLPKTLDKMGMKWTFHKDVKKLPKNPMYNYIRFQDGILEYEASSFSELILNGLTKLNPSELTFDSVNEDGSGCDEYIRALWGNYRGLSEIKNFYEFLIDPITKDICKDFMLPTKSDELLMHSVKLLCDNSSVSKSSDKSYRIRSVEIIPSILYSCIANQYKTHVKSGRKNKMTLDQRVVISRLIAEKTVDEYSTLNPAIEVAKYHTISTRGYRGSNSDYSYQDEAKRSYDPSAIGKLAMSTSPDANVGISKELVIEPTISNARGYREPVDDIDELKDVNIFSPVEMLTPGTVRGDDPIRIAIANKQSQHLVPVKDSSPALVSNGFDEALQFHLSNDFVINAEEDGEVVENNEELGFIVVKYKSGKNLAITTNPDVVKNSGSGFYLSNKLKPTLTKVGQKFKKDEVLAYHDKYFKYSPTNGLRYAIGPLVKMAFISTYNTYEDAGICTEQLADKMKTDIVYLQEATFKRNNNILYMVNIGDKVGIGDPLIRYDVSSEHDELSKYLTKLSEGNKTVLEEETKNDVKADNAGTVVDIKVYSIHDPSNLSPSLGKIVKHYFDKGTSKKEFLEKYDSSNGILKAGYLLRDNTEPTVNRYNTIKKYKGIDVLIEIYIEHSDVMGVGDKVALYSANKQIISEVIPAGYEPYSEFRPDEEISVITSPGTIARRMTSSVIAVSSAMKVMIELKRSIRDRIKYSK